MKLKEFYQQVERVADTNGLHISAAETSRVLACMFEALKALPVQEALDVFLQGVKKTRTRKGG